MAQATESHTTRRNFLSGAAAVAPLMLLVPDALAATESDADLYEAHRAVEAAVANAQEMSLVLDKAESQFDDWEKANPRPAMRRVYISLGPDPNLDLKKAMYRHEVVIAEWGGRRRLVEAPVDEANAKWAAALDQMDAARERFFATVPQTVGGLKLQAREAFEKEHYEHLARHVLNTL